MHSIVDLRSDTVTKPTPAMREAMANAEVGDDVFDDDPTVHRLQQRAAELTGCEAALFMPSGTMSNTVAICTHTQPGDEILLDAEAHSLLYEVGAPARIAQVITRPFPSKEGIPHLEAIKGSFHKPTLHGPGTTLLILENTHNRSGGYPIPLEVHQEIYALCRTEGVRVHIDGARIFNAAVATHTSVAQFAAYTDSITFCLSKGLGCPVGSLLCGTNAFIERARRVRKMLGGGMRQVGILAAAGLYALENHIQRLVEDHRRAQKLAESLSKAPNISLDTPVPPTNMVYFHTKAPAPLFVDLLKTQQQVLCHAVGPNRIRLVTHLDIDDDDVAHAANAICYVASQLSKEPNSSRNCS